MNDRKQNNKGFSLIELIVAVAIIALVVGPILHAFYTSARVNRTSKDILKATTVAQNIMEDIKGTPLSVLLGASSEAVVTDMGDGNYKLTYENQEIADEKYKVVVTLDAEEYKAATGEAANYNDYEQPEVYTMDSATNGFYVPAKGMAQTCANLFGDTAAYSNMDKTTTININENVNMQSADVSVKYEYNGTVQEEAKNSYIYRETTGENKLRGVYIYFEPMYTAVGRHAKENIIINNNGLIPVTVYLVKQTTSETNAVNEANYAVNVKVNETGRTQDWTSADDYKALTTIRTNLEEEQMLLTYSGAVTTFDAKTMVDLDEVVGGVVEDKLYKVEVAVYDEDDEEKVKITGTKEK